MRISKHPAWAVFGLSLILYLSGTWILPLFDRDEPRFAEASREMLERGDYVVPWFNGEWRFDKPPLIYWAEMASYRVFGENEFAARLPSALFGAGTAVLVLFWARRMAKPGTAVAAAVIFATTLQMLIHARLAVADMPLIFFVAAAGWSGWEMTRPGAEGGARWWWMFNVSLALGFLAKGPVAWIPIGGVVVGRWLWPGEFGLGWGRFAAGLVVAMGIVALWGIPAILATHGEFLNVGIGYHVLFRSFGVINGHGAGSWLQMILWLPYFFVLFFFSFFPWCIRVPGALRAWWPARRSDVFGGYLLLQAGLIFLVFTLVRTKLPHYTLPAFPFIAIWLAREAERGAIGDLKVGRGAAAMAVLALVLTLPGFWLARREFVSQSIFEKSKPYLNRGMKFATVDYTEASLVWLYRGVTTNYMETLSDEEAGAFVQQSNPFVLIVPSSLYQTDRVLHAADTVSVEARGLNVAKIEFKGQKLQWTDLTAVIRQ